MADLQIPISYCANAHAGVTLAKVRDNLVRFAAPTRQHRQAPTGVGLWVPASAIPKVHSPDEMDEIRTVLSDHKLVTYTMNAFPFGDFHAQRVKDAVYRPDWSTRERLEYTCRIADMLVCLLPDGMDGSISTLPCAFGRHHQGPVDFSRYLPSFIAAARHLARIKTETGKTIRLAIEPEPLCLLETTAQAIIFFHELWRSTDSTPEARLTREHLGLCYDVCHQAVEFEDVSESIESLLAHEVSIVKVQASCALELADPRDADAREELAAFVEERYLHQTFARHPNGQLLSREDLDADLTRHPPAEWLDCPSWRIHFHVPIHRETMGRLRTTRSVLREACHKLTAREVACHWEVETYTWNLLVEGEQTPALSLVDGLVAELNDLDSMLNRNATGLRGETR